MDKYGCSYTELGYFRSTTNYILFPGNLELLLKKFNGKRYKRK